MAYEVWPNLDPNEVLEFGFDWVDRLDDGDSIASSTWELTSGDVTLDAESKPPTLGGTIVKVWLTGGTLGTTSIVTNHIVTSAGRKRDRSAKLKIRAK